MKTSNPRRPPVQAGQVIVVEPDKLVPGGDSLARVDGFPVFVAGIYPGDRASVRIVELKKGFARGELVELVHPSPFRRESPCPVARECGGCDWTELRLDAQLRAKRSILIESLTRVGRMDTGAIPPIRIHPSPLNYRLRSRLHIDPAGRPGFYARASHRVVPLPDSCEVVGPATLAVASRARFAPPVETVLFFESNGGLRTEAQPWDSEPAPVTVRSGGNTWTTTVDGFFQVNFHLLSTMQRLVTRLASSSARRGVAFDLYGGAGFFADSLAQSFARVVTVESSPAGHACAKINTQNMPNVETVLADVASFLEDCGEADLIFLDPPRAGAAPGVIDRIATLAREAVCYLSCDPVTFSRDVSRLLRRGWTPLEIHLLDLFPNTHHVETLAVFRRD